MKFTVEFDVENEDDSDMDEEEFIEDVEAQTENALQDLGWSNVMCKAE